MRHNNNIQQEIGEEDLKTIKWIAILHCLNLGERKNMIEKLSVVTIKSFVKLDDWLSLYRHIRLVRLFDKHLVKVVQPIVLNILFTLVVNSLISTLKKGTLT